MKDFSHPLFDDYFWYPKLASTSNQALKLIQDRSVHGHFLVVADVQTNGRGRKGATWFSPGGGIWLTTAFYDLPEQSTLTILIGNCIHQALVEVFPEIADDLLLKWPNDVMLSGLKIAGILTEQFPALNYTLVGIGIDSNVQNIPSEIAVISTSLSIFTGKEVDNVQILTKVFETLARNLPGYLENGINDSVKYHNRFSFLRDKQIEIMTDFGSYSGFCRGLNREGAIILEMDSGLRQPFFSGSINIHSAD